ncbi:MAG TPA: PQQ-dependent sugar dehydrogenase [Geminicoccaceae bacterium]|nr:PQQ-dependent sugar dehydrogenase [Geminicoccaceae bacterium]
MRRTLIGTVSVLALLGAPGLAVAQTASDATGAKVPEAREDVAQPGGQVPGVPELALVKVADGFADPVNVASAFDGSGRLFVVERVGRIRIVDREGNVLPEPFLDLTTINPLGTDVQTGFVEQGLYSVAFHPNFSENGYFFVHYASLPFNGDGVIVRFTVDPESPDQVTADRANETAKVILRIPQPYYNHNGGEIAFGPNDGYLYISSGDGGWEGDPLEAGQDLTLWLGKLLRIDVDVEDRPYNIPDDNPLAQASDERLMVLFGITEEEFSTIKTRSRPEIWAYGLRNPYEFAFDRETGDLFIADVGQNHWEEIDWQPADSPGGENYGWAHNQGSHCFPITGEDTQDCPVVGVLPVAEYPHETPYPGAEPLREGFGCSVQGFAVANYAGMRGVYLAGDWCSGRVWAVGWDDEQDKWQLQELMQTQLQFTAGGIDEDGTVLAVNCNCFYIGEQGPEENPPGALWRFVPAGEVPEGAETARVGRP